MAFQRSPSAPTLALLGLALATPVSAQESLRPEVRAFAEVTALYAQPLGDFRDQVDHGVGAALALRIPLDRSRGFSLRLDGSVINYGHEAREACLSQTLGCRVEVRQTTSNDILTVGMGPELAGAWGPLQPFVHAYGGASAFLTESSLRGVSDEDAEFAGTYNHEDLTFSWGGGAGVRARTWIGGVPLHFTLATRYHNNGSVDYLREGDITDLPDGSVSLDVQRSRADLLSFQIGASVGLPLPTFSDGRR